MKIDWAYLRKGWASCKKAQEVLDAEKIAIVTEVNARKEPISSDQAWGLLSKSQKLFIAKGKKVLEFVPNDDNKSAIIKEAIGRSGKLRAPTIKIGNLYYIGFQVDMYAQLVG